MSNHRRTSNGRVPRNTVLTLTAFSLFTLIGTFGAAPQAQGCSVPVFRYALQRWMPTVYQVLVIHDQPLTAEQQSLIEELQKTSIEADYASNYDIRAVEFTIPVAVEADEGESEPEPEPEATTESAADEKPAEADVSESEEQPEATSDAESTEEGATAEETTEAPTEEEPTGESRERSSLEIMWEKAGKPSLPHVLLVYPMLPPPQCLFDHMPFDKEHMAGFTDSPLRQQIAKHILDGTTGVWVVLQSGDAEKDKAAEETIRAGSDEFVKAYTEEMEEYNGDDTEETDAEEETDEGADEAEAAEEAAPTQDPYDPYSEYDPLEEEAVDPKFEVLVVSRDDPKERLLVNLLMQTEPDLFEYAEQPMAFPIFGRGRALYALVGEGITENNVLDVCGFLIGPCSCTVKDMNPGIDLVMTVNWDEELMRLEEEQYAAATESTESTEPEMPLVGLSSLADAVVEDSPAEDTSTQSAETTDPADDPAVPAVTTTDVEPSGQEYDATSNTTEPTATDVSVEPAAASSSILVRTGIICFVLFLIAVLWVALRPGQG